MPIITMPADHPRYDRIEQESVRPFVTLGEFRRYTAEFPDSMIFCIGVFRPLADSPHWQAAHADCLTRNLDVIHMSGDAIGETG